ncbi:MAG: helix-turn-helix domain-containing protein [Candidatus Riflebacteria bacterium]|nr:helix-turn-helix domain-containing protein [Candidatus Riflebacteria bacterium]
MDVPKRDSMKFLKWASRHKKFIAIRDRIRAIILAKRGKTISEISDQLEFSPRWVQKWVARYRDAGFKALWDKPHSGAPKHLPTDREEAFVERIFQGPKTEDKISIFHGYHIQKILQEEFGATYSESGVYALLDRLKLS